MQNFGDPDNFDGIGTRLNALRLSNDGQGFVTRTNLSVASAPPLSPETVSERVMETCRSVDGSSDTEFGYSRELSNPSLMTNYMPCHQDISGQGTYPNLTQFQSESFLPYQQHMAIPPSPVRVLGGFSMRKEMKELQREKQNKEHQMAVSEWRHMILTGVNKQLKDDYRVAESFISTIRNQIENTDHFNNLLREISLHVGFTMRMGTKKIHTGIRSPSIPVPYEFRQKRWLPCEMKYIEDSINDFNNKPENRKVVKIVIQFQKNTGVLNFIGLDILDKELRHLVLSKKTGGKWNGTQYY